MKLVGVVTSINEDSGYAKLMLLGAPREFHLSCFHGGRPARRPRPPESVEVVLDDDFEIVEVRAI